MAVKFVLRMSFCYLFSVHFLLARLATFAFRHRHNTVSGNTGRFSAPRNKNHNMLNNLVKLTRFLHLHFCVANNDSSSVKSKQLKSYSLKIAQILYQFEEKKSHFHLPIIDAICLMIILNFQLWEQLQNTLPRFYRIRTRPNSLTNIRNIN